MNTPSSPFPDDPNKSAAFHLDIKDIEQQLKNLSSHAEELKLEMTDLKHQSSALPRQISSINAELARLEAVNEHTESQSRLQHQLNQQLEIISGDYQKLAEKERSLQSALIKANSDVYEIENMLKLEKMKAGTQHFSSRR